ncbi:GntR family transcriptional regulator [Ruminococcaceae bacterium OttesenSCG-928-D13]|nr:GntR family transcriptional regulator [Ruminococcaceae bacterium OttesenSCG-928-D13]
MNILISNSDGRPIYEQITAQVKSQILGGQLASGDALPSIRALARDLRISVITTKRAYEDLERDGFIETIPGKGSFVASKNPEFLREERLRVAEGHLAKAVDVAKTSGITQDELAELLALLYQSEG